MSGFVVVLLVGLWVAILVPGALRGRMHSPATSVDSFERSMSILATDLRNRRVLSELEREGRAGPREVVAHRTAARHRSLHRRRVILQGLGGAAGATAIPAVMYGGVFSLVFGTVAAALVAYVALLLHIRSGHVRARRTVAHLPVRATGSGGDVVHVDDDQVLSRVAGEQL